MDSIAHIVGGIITRSLANQEDGDYMAEDGFLMCGKCHTRKQHEVPFPDSKGGSQMVRVGVACKCRQAELEAEKKADEEWKFQQRMIALRKDGITDPAYLRHTFDQDDGKNPKVTDVCRRYVENWEEMSADNIGILFYGDVGTGKSFMACCIANALLERLVSVSVTNFPRILNKLQGAFDDERQEFVNRLQRYSLLVIDDLGVERDTSYSVEQVFNVIDTRSRSGKPLIVTTNLSMKDLQSAPTLAHQRIYDRVLEMCPIRLSMTGGSRRTDIASERRDKARQILGLGTERK